MTQFMNNLLFKVLLWRLISIVLTLATTYFYSGDIREASGLTMVLHAVLIVSHYVFEKGWLHFTDKVAGSE